MSSSVVETTRELEPVIVRVASLDEVTTPSFGSAVASGSLGVRGMMRFNVEVVAACREEDLHDLIASELTGLYDQGVRRVHALVTRGSTEERAASLAGFVEPEGELLHELRLNAAPSAELSLPTGYTLRDGDTQDLRTIGLSLQHVPELAFQSWEYPLISAGVGEGDRFFKVIEYGGEIVGVSIGGTFGVRGTISHIWVAHEHRRGGLGAILTNASLTALYESGAREVHLMTVQGNDSARRFWERQGFEVSECIFLEKDL